MPRTATISVLDGETFEVDARKYELLWIIPNTVTEDQVSPIMKTIHDLIESLGGKITKEVNYGKRRLAYPVKHNHYGYYILQHFDMLADECHKLEKKLRVHESILRHLITHQLPADATPQEVDLKQELKPVQEKREEIRKKPSIIDREATKEEQEKIKKGSAFDLEKELGVTAEEATKELAMAKETATDRKESVDMEKLEEKLDEIMGTVSEAEKDADNNK